MDILYKEKKVSVIVPVFKVEKYISRCIESLLQQSYKNLEIILVDDGSPDNSGKICDAYAKKDDRIIVLHQENMGQSEARNNAIIKSSGDYFVFVDSDDEVPCNMVENLLVNCERNDSQICIGNFKLFKDSFEYKDDKYIENSPIIYNGSELIPIMHTVPGEKYVVMWGKIFKSELFDNISFPKGRICEDLAVLYKLYDKAEKVTIIDHVVYGYYRGNEISSTFSLSKKFYDDVYIALDEELDYMIEYHPEYIAYPSKTYMYWLLDEYRKLFYENMNPEIRGQLHKKYCELYKNCSKIKVEKFYRLFRFFPNTYCLAKRYF